MWVVKFLRTHGLIHDCPKLVQLRTFPTIAVGGDPEGAAGLLTAMVCHLAVFHPPGPAADPGAHRDTPTIRIGPG